MLNISMNSRSAVAILVFCVSTNRLFLLERSKSSSFPGVWGGVSGGIEDYENHADTLKRELIEELGINIYESIYDIFLLFKKDMNNLKFFQYIGMIDYEFIPTATFPNEENNAWRWVELNNIPTPIYPDLLPIINTLKDLSK